MKNRNILPIVALSLLTSASAHAGKPKGSIPDSRPRIDVREIAENAVHVSAKTNRGAEARLSLVLLRLDDQVDDNVVTLQVATLMLHQVIRNHPAGHECALNAEALLGRIVEREGIHLESANDAAPAQTQDNGLDAPGAQNVLVEAAEPQTKKAKRGRPKKERKSELEAAKEMKEVVIEENGQEILEPTDLYTRDMDIDFDLPFEQFEVNPTIHFDGVEVGDANNNANPMWDELADDIPEFPALEDDPFDSPVLPAPTPPGFNVVTDLRGTVEAALRQLVEGALPYVAAVAPVVVEIAKSSIKKPKGNK